MRTIKFRAWDKTNQKMFNPFTYVVTFGFLTKDENTELMQFTGLTDKNGKEIYEADVVKEGKSIGIVKFDLGRFYIDWFENPELWSETLHYHDEKSKIIGNIYEDNSLPQ